MTTRRKGKHNKMRGSHTHGGGAKKKRRGSGNRGGFGMAGSGKRADQNKQRVFKLYGPEYFGKRGFKRPQKIIKRIKAVNFEYFNVHVDSLLNKKLIKKEGDFYIIDVEKLGYNKVLGKGVIDHKLKIKSPFFSKSAVEKLKRAGCEILKEN